jgi:lipoprotein signal peptidase
MMVNAELVDGADLANAIDRLFTESGIVYIHAHYAKRGCYAARIDRC